MSRISSESNLVVSNNVNCSMCGIVGQIGQVHGFKHYTLATESGVTVEQDGHYLDKIVVWYNSSLEKSF